MRTAIKNYGRQSKRGNCYTTQARSSTRTVAIGTSNSLSTTLHSNCWDKNNRWAMENASEDIVLMVKFLIARRTYEFSTFENDQHEQQEEDRRVEAESDFGPSLPKLENAGSMS